MSLAELQKLKNHSFEVHFIRPTSEIVAHSLMIRVCRNCPWGRCKFCDCYLYGKFECKSIEEVKHDIDEIKAISDEIQSLEKRVGGMDWVARVISCDFLYEKHPSELKRDELENFRSIINVFDWLSSGARTVFLQDGDSLQMPNPNLIEIIKYLKKTFPSIERITSYARADTLANTKTIEELKELHKAGLFRLHVGFESGDDEVLEYIDKGVTSEGQILAGKKTKESGIQISEYFMPGIAGRDRSEKHAINSARVLNEINPNFIMMRPYVPQKNTVFFDEYMKGEFQLTSPHERLKELKLFFKDLNVTSRVCFDQPAFNTWYRDRGRSIPLFRLDYMGYKFPEEKEKVLKLIDLGLSIDESIHIHAKDRIGKPY